MGYTRYWKTTENKYDTEVISTINTILEIAKKDFGIILRSGDDSGDPIVNDEYISINGDGYNDLDCDSFIIVNGYADGFDFCKTERKPYDIVVNALLQYLDDEGIIHHVTSNGPNMEEHAKALLTKALKPSENKYVLEAYDKDNDVYWKILHTHTLEDAKTLAGEITNHDWTLYMPSGEPIDWFIITDKTTNKPITYLDMFDKTWKNF